MWYYNHIWYHYILNIIDQNLAWWHFHTSRQLKLKYVWISYFHMIASYETNVLLMLPCISKYLMMSMITLLQNGLLTLFYKNFKCKQIKKIKHRWNLFSYVTGCCRDIIFIFYKGYLFGRFMYTSFYENKMNICTPWNNHKQAEGQC